MNNFYKPKLGITILRLGLAVVFLWFGFSQLIETVAWISWVPDWAVALSRLSPEMIVRVNGSFEVIAGALLATNFLVRPSAMLLAAHLALITFDIGLTQIGLRDFGLTMATLALALLAPPEHGEKRAVEQNRTY